MPAPRLKFWPASYPISRRRIVRLPRAQQGSGKGSGHGRRNPPGEPGRPGDPVRETGIYEVCHAGDHRAAHEVVMLAGDLFPTCDTCQGMVRFQLLRTAPYIFQDEDFEDQR